MFNYFDLTSTTDYEYLLAAVGTDVVLNGSTTIRALITNKNLNQNYDDRNISSLSPLKRGDIIEYDAKRFMVISEEAGKRYNKWKGIMRFLPYSITFNSSCVFFDIPAYVETSSFGVQDGQVISLASGQINLYVPDNSDALRISLSDRFIKLGQAFKVVGIDRYSKSGMAILTCEKDSINPASDDIENEVAGGLACSVSITNTEPVEVYEGATLQLTWTATNGFPVVFSSSNPLIATVDSTGLIIGIGLGTATITVENAANGAIKDTVNVTIVEVPASLTMSISGATQLYTGSSMQETYTVQVFNGATQITDGSQPVTWSLWDDTKTTTTTYATIQSQNGTSCVLRGVTINKYVQLKVTLTSDNSIVAWFRIRVSSLI